MGKQLFMLDCDGTLMDTIDAWHDAERSIASKIGIELSKEERDLLNTYTLEEVSAFFFENYGIGSSPDAVLGFINDYMLDYYKTKSEAVAGALEFVKDAHAAGVSLCVLSSSPLPFLQAGLERGGFLPFIDDVVSVEEIGMTKRDPDTYAHVCEREGAAVEDAVFFDDSWYALEAARKAGCRAVGVYSCDWCGTHDQLAAHAERIIDDFTKVNAADFLNEG